MKFAIAALLAVTSAEQIAVSRTIAYNTEGLDNAATYGHKAIGSIHHQAKENNIKYGKAIVEAYSQHRVEEYVHM